MTTKETSVHATTTFSIDGVWLRYRYVSWSVSTEAIVQSRWCNTVWLRFEIVVSSV